MSDITIHPRTKETLLHPMNTRTRHGYARLVRDLAELDHHDRFQDMLTRAYGAMDELGLLIERAHHLAQENTRDPNTSAEDPESPPDLGA